MRGSSPESGDERKKRHDSSNDDQERGDRRRSRSRSRSEKGERSKLSPERRKHRDRSRSKEKRSRDRSRSRDHKMNEKRDRSKDRDRHEKSGADDKRGDAGKDGSALPAKKKQELLTTKTGGAYIPPAKLRMMQKNITDKSSEAYQRLAWEALKKSINGKPTVR